MVDIRKDFGDSFQLLSQHKKIILPVFFSVLISLILIFLFLNLSGLTPLLNELVDLNDEFNQQKQDYLLNRENMGKEGYTSELVNYIGKDSSNSAYDNQYSSYLEQKGYDWGRYKQLLNMENVVLLVIFLLIGIIGSFYFSCMSYAIISLVLKKKEIDRNILFRVTNKFLLKLFSLKILFGFIIIVPLAIIVTIVIFLFFLNTILGVLSIFVFVILFIAYLLLVGLRLFFTTPSMFMEENGVINSISHSWHLTLGHIKQVLIIFFVIWGIGIFISSFVVQPLYNTYSNFLFESGWVKAFINLLLVVLFLILEAFVFTFQHLFLFYTYIDFKKLSGIVK